MKILSNSYTFNFHTVTDELYFLQYVAKGNKGVVKHFCVEYDKFLVMFEDDTDVYDFTDEWKYYKEKK